KPPATRSNGASNRFSVTLRDGMLRENGFRVNSFQCTAAARRERALPGELEVMMADEKGGRTADNGGGHDQSRGVVFPGSQGAQGKQTRPESPRVAGRAGAKTLDPKAVTGVETQAMRRQGGEAHQQDAGKNPPLRAGGVDSTGCSDRRDPDDFDEG